MRIFLLPFLFLPFLEILGFLTIGARIGIGWTFLWLIGSTTLGVYLLQSGGLTALMRARHAKTDDIFAVSDLFDGISMLIGALLLIFPGFISDFLALPFLIAPCRHWMFGRMKDDPDVFVRRYARKNETVIDGEWKRTDNETDKLPRQ